MHENTTSMKAEATTILMELRRCQNLNLHDIILENDSLDLRKINTDKWKIPWQLTIQIEEIKQLIRQLQIMNKHLFREANQLVDKLANVVLDQPITLVVDNFSQLPIECRKLLNSDTAQISNLRIRAR